MKNFLIKQLNILTKLDRYRLFVSFLIGFCLAGFLNLLLIVAEARISLVVLIAIYVLCVVFLPFLIYKILNISQRQRLPYLIGLLLLGSFLAGMIYESIDGTLSDTWGFLLFIVPIVLVPVTALSTPFAIWTSLSLGKKVYLSLWSFYAVLLTIFVWPREPYNDNRDDFFIVRAFVIIAALCLVILAIHLLIIRRYSQVVASRKKVKVARSKHLRQITKKVALIVLGGLALAGILWVLTFNWTPSKEFTELINQEEALALPKADERLANDKCHWTQHKELKDEKTRHCYQNISLIYNDITLVGQVRDRLVANGWKEDGYVQHIGSTRLGDPPTIDQISQGIMPTLASKSDYFFVEKQGEFTKICAKVIVFAKGDPRNPIDPSLTLYLSSC